MGIDAIGSLANAVQDFMKLLRKKLGVSSSRDASAPKAPPFNLQRHLLPALLVLGAGIALGASLAPMSAWGIAWIAVAPLWIAAVRSQTPKEAMFLGLCWGVGYHGTALSWVFGLHPLTWLGLSWVASITIATLAWCTVALWGAALAAVWAGGLCYLSQFSRGGLRLVVGAALWYALEWIWNQSPLWWTALANSQSPNNVALLQLSSLSGADAIAFGILLVNGALAEAWLTRQGRFLLVAILVFLSLHGLGWGLSQRTTAINPQNTATIGLVQGNLPSRLKLSPSGGQKSVATYEQGYRDLADQNVDAVLLPEGALPFLWGRSYGLEAPLLRAVEAEKVPLWAGVFMPQAEGYHQSLLSLTGEGTVSGQYNKVKLVPLGEYLPFEQWIKPVLSRLSPLKVGMIAGENHQRFDTAIGRAIVGICYDSVFSELFRAQAAAGGQFILSVANNDPFGARMMGQHHALDVLRAIETDRWLIRATNTGISAVIDPQGHSQWISPTNVSLTHIAKIERRTTQTLYVRVGNWFLPLCLAFSTALWFKYRDRPQLNRTSPIN